MAYTTGFEEFFWVDSGGAWPNSGTATTFTVPANVYWVWVVGVAGGGGGGSSTKYFAVDGGGGGGGAGESVEGIMIPTTPKGTIPIYVGGGGAGGIKTTLAYNVAVEPEYPNGTGAFNAGFGGEKTTVGPIALMGGWGGSSGGSSPHSGMGGGVGAGRRGNNPGLSGSNAAQSISGSGSNGYNSTNKYEAKYWSGSGGGSGSYANDGFTPPSGGSGGPLGPFQGGAGGTVSGTLLGGGAGGGGGSSIFGPGAAGGNSMANASTVPSTSYGAGGGGGGGNDNTNIGGTPPYPNAWLGSKGAPGYVAIFWITDNSTTYTLRAQPGFFTLTGNAVTFTYP